MAEHLFMCRTIYPTGFGAFCTEQLKIGDETINVVYDCGSHNSKDGIEESVFVRQQTHVDYLFISHCHEDHINGLELLNIDQRTIVFLPYFFHVNLRVLVRALNLQYREVLGLLESKKAKIIYVKALEERDIIEDLPSKNIEEFLDSQNADIEECPFGIEGSILSTFSRLTITGENGCLIWEYIPFHILQKSSIEKLLQRCSSVSPDGRYNSRKEVHDAVKEVKNEMKKLQIDLNLSSMLLVSRAVSHEVDIEYFYEQKYPSRRFYVDGFYPKGCKEISSCLYTGDASFNDPTCVQLFRPIKQRVFPQGIFYVQLPHHGSSHNFNELIYTELKPSVAFVNFCSSPKSRQPELDHNATALAIKNQVQLFGIAEFPEWGCLRQRIYF